MIDTYGEPHEATGSMLVWYGVGPWKRMIATREYENHYFPMPHIDAVTSVIDYRVPPEVVSELAAYDGSVVVARTAVGSFRPLPRRAGQLPCPEPDARHRHGRQGRRRGTRLLRHRVPQRPSRPIDPHQDSADPTIVPCSTKTSSRPPSRANSDRTSPQQKVYP